MLAAFHERRPRVALQHEIAKWGDLNRKGLRDPRRALAGWLNKADDMSDSDFSSLEWATLAATMSPEEQDEYIRARLRQARAEAGIV